MKKKVLIIVMVLVMFFSNSMYVFASANSENNLLDDINYVYQSVTDGDLWKGFLGIFTNTLGYVTNKTDKASYNRFLDDFDLYCKNYDLKVDDHIKFDSKNKILTIDKDLQKAMINFLNQETFNDGYFKVTSNPALIAQIIVKLNIAVENHPKKTQFIDEIMEIINTDNVGFAQIQLLKGGLDGAVFKYVYYTNRINKMMRTHFIDSAGVIVSNATRDQILPVLFGKQPLNSYVRFDNVMGISNSTLTNDTYSLGDGGTITITASGNLTRDTNGTSGGYRTAFNQNGDDMLSNIRTFVFGKGSFQAYVNGSKYGAGQYDTYYSTDYKNYEPVADINYNADTVINGDHYEYHKNITNEINNYIENGTDITNEQISAYINSIKETIKYQTKNDDENTNSIINIVKKGFKDVVDKLDILIKDIKNISPLGKDGKQGVLDILGGIFGEFVKGLINLVFGIIESVFGTLMTLVTNLAGFIGETSLSLINKMFALFDTTTYETDLGEVGNVSDVQGTVSIVYGFIPKPLLAAFIIVFIAYVIVVIVKFL